MPQMISPKAGCWPFFSPCSRPLLVSRSQTTIFKIWMIVDPPQLRVVYYISYDAYRIHMKAFQNDFSLADVAGLVQ
jgi:hypothetical protein